MESGGLTVPATNGDPKVMAWLQFAKQWGLGAAVLLVVSGVLWVNYSAMIERLTSEYREDIKAAKVEMMQERKLRDDERREARAAINEQILYVRTKLADLTTRTNEVIERNTQAVEELKEELRSER